MKEQRYSVLLHQPVPFAIRMGLRTSARLVMCVVQVTGVVAQAAIAALKGVPGIKAR